MKNNIPTYKNSKLLFKYFLITALLSIIISSCDEEVLVEKPLDFLSSDIVLTDEAGFESAIYAMHSSIRNVFYYQDGSKQYSLQLGTDVAFTGEAGLPDFKDYRTWLNPTQWSVEHYWEWAYLELMPRANTIIKYAENAENMSWATEDQKNEILAEAKFFRAYAYNLLANLYGGVPIVDEIYGEPKADFERNTREEVYEFAKNDLEFAAQHLPTEASVDGRVEKGAANHLLTEVYISLGEYSNAVESATSVISSGRYQLMTERFGSHSTDPGDVYSDLFATGNQNRSSGNLESIWNIQFEPRSTPGGTAKDSRWYGCSWLRAWGPKWYRIPDPDGNEGMVLNEDSLGRGVAWVRPTNYFFYDIWSGNENDMRNSPYNIRREFYYNNPESDYYGQQVDYDELIGKDITVDTMEMFYPMIRKIEGEAEKTEGSTYGRSFDDVYVMRLAETYLLRAEAHFLNGQAQLAADDINVVRNRANATSVNAGEVDLDYILDERARELIIEENRRLTLNRMGKLAERVRKYNPYSGETVQDYHNLYPLPQSTIDANINAELTQNTGY